MAACACPLTSASAAGNQRCVCDLARRPRQGEVIARQGAAGVYAGEQDLPCPQGYALPGPLQRTQTGRCATAVHALKCGCTGTGAPALDSHNLREHTGPSIKPAQANLSRPDLRHKPGLFFGPQTLPDLEFENSGRGVGFARI
jgi:hypothetical protein